MGAGAIGSLIGGFLARSGFDVTLIGRKKHVEAIRKNGLTIKGVSGNFRMNVKSTARVDSLNDVFDLVILTVKAYDTKKAVAECKPLFGYGTILLCLQNGLGVEDEASGIVAKERVLRGITNNGAQLEKPSVVLHTGVGETVLGKPNKDGSSDAERVAGIFDEAGLKVKVASNIHGAVWVKALVNVGINPFGALTKMRNGELLTTVELKNLMAETVMEGVRVAGRLGVKLDEADPVSVMFRTAEATAENRNSMLQDIERGKRTEIDYINGAIARLGFKVGVQTPLNSLLTYLIKGLEKAGGAPYL